MIEPRLRFKTDDGSDFPDWEEKRLEDVVEFLDEKRKPLEAGKRVAGKYPYYGASGIIDYVEDYIFDEELILLSEDGANILDRNYRVCFLAKGKYWVNNHAHVMKAKKGNLNYFICEELETFDYRKYNSGGAQPKLNQASCRSIVVKIPSLPEQQKIADFLSTIDTIIEKQQATVSAWEERKKGVMQKLFSQEVRFKADDGSDFPDWEEKKVASLGDMVGGGTPTTKKKEYWHGRTAWISSADVEENDIYNINMTRFITQEAIDNSATKIIPKNSILIVSRVGVGKVAKAPCDLCTSQDFTNIVDVKGDSTFLTYAVLRLMQSKLQCVQGTSIKGIPSDEIRNYIMNIPSLPEQQKIADCLSALDIVIQKQKETLEKWQELKKGLLQQMFV